MKMKSLAILCIFAILLPPVLALGPTDANMADEVNAVGLTQAQMQDIAQSLVDIEPAKGDLGLQDVNLFDLWIGNEILAYEYTKEGFAQLEFSLYPLFAPDNEVVALVIKSGTGAEAETKQISTILASTVNEVIGESNQIALVYSAEGCAVYNGTDVKVVIETQTDIPERALLPENAIEVVGERAALATCVPQYPIADYICRAQQGDTDEPVYDTVVLRTTLVTKKSDGSESNLCWAGTMAMVLDYIDGGEHTIASVATDCLGRYSNVSASTEDVRAYYSDEYGHRFLYLDPLESPYIHEYIYNNRYPLHGQFNAVTATGLFHAALIYGVSGNASIIWIKDPDFGTETGYLANKSGNHHQIHYVSSVSGVKFALAEALYYTDEDWD